MPVRKILGMFKFKDLSAFSAVGNFRGNLKIMVSNAKQFGTILGIDVQYVHHRIDHSN